VLHVITNFSLLLDKRDRELQLGADILRKLGKVKIFLNSIGWFTDSYPIEQFVLNKRCRQLGDDYLDTILAMNNLAITL
jgi:hypothetical protein